MIGSTVRPCQACAGAGVIVVKAAPGSAAGDVTKPCPVCKGSKVTTGIVAK